MKKSLIIAACIAAVGFSSCSNDEEFVNIHNPGGENGATPIMLAMSKGNASVTTRGTGAVGDEDNKWRSEKLNVFMLDNETFEPALDYNGAPIFENAVISAPASTDNGNNFADYGTPKYYPMSGNYNFFMYHADDAATAEPAKDTDKYVLPITIDGSQDLMISKADMPEAQKNAFTSHVGTENANRYYSAFSARKKIGLDGSEDLIGIQPYFNLDHLLARLVFHIEPGTKDVSNLNEDASNNYLGVTIDSIQILNVNRSADFIVAWDGAAPAKHIINEDNQGDVTLKSYKDGETEAHKLEKFTPVKPEWDETNDKAISKRVGESLMLFPAESYDLKIYMSQTPHAGSEVIKFTHYQKLQVSAAGKFEAGKQYNVKFVVYGAEKISAILELTPWEESDDLNADFENRIDE